jgi:hypothetical protein
MKLKRLAAFTALLAVSFAGFNVIATPSASAASVTWTGGNGSNTNFSFGGNWVGGSAPTSIDEAVFPANAAHKSVTVANTAIQFMEFSGVANDCSAVDYTFSGTRLDIGGTANGLLDANNYASGCGATITFNNSEVKLLSEFDLQNKVNSDTQIIFGTSSSQILNLNNKKWNVFNGPDSEVTVNATLTGDTSTMIDIQEGLLSLTDASAFKGTITTRGAGSLRLYAPQTFVESGFIRIKTGATFILEPDNFTADIDAPLQLILEAGTHIKVPSDVNHTITLGRSTTLGEGDPIEVYIAKANLVFGGDLSGSGYFVLRDDSQGTLKVDANPNTATFQPNKTLSMAPHTNTYSEANSTAGIRVMKNETAIVNGKYAAVIVESGGILKGTGSVGTLTVLAGGIVAPGQSPGCLTAGNTTFNASSTYEAELAGTEPCTSYDQLKVTGTVTLGDTNLSTKLLNNFKPKAGDTFIIVDNDSNDAITGTFANLAEGATFTVDGYVFKVTYKGGDGNDVAITVQTVPTTPNTGVQLLAANPLLTLAGTVLSAGTLFVIARRYSLLGRK